MEVARNGVDGKHLIEEETFDLVILDVMLPGLDGWQLVQVVRQRSAHTPVLFSPPAMRWKTGCAGWNWAPTTTSSNPFPTPSCWRGCARCCVAARRGKSSISTSPTELDLLRRRVARQGERINLTKEFALLHLLLSRQGEVLSMRRSLRRSGR